MGSAGLPATSERPDDNSSDDEGGISQSITGSCEQLEELLKIPPLPSEGDTKAKSLADAGLEKWHARVREMREDLEEEEAIDETTGWLWGAILPRLRDSVGKGEKRNKSGTRMRGSTESAHPDPTESTNS